MNLVPADTLRELTDRAKAPDQIAWLRERGWRFEVSATGRPKVDSAEYERHMIGGAKKKDPQPDLSWFNEKTRNAG